MCISRQYVISILIQLIKIFIRYRIVKKEPNELSNNVHIVSSYFMSTLLNGEVDKAAKYHKKVNLFSTKLLLIPLCLEFHWSLCVIENLNKIDEEEETR
jgi:Ulp1 family protease